MSELPPREPSDIEKKEGEERESLRKQIIDSLIELYEAKKVFDFPGLTSEAYTLLKAAEEEYGAWTTPIDELIVRLEKEGMKVVPKESYGNDIMDDQVFILPAKSNDTNNDSISPDQLEVNEGMPENLKNLILAYKKLRNRT